MGEIKYFLKAVGFILFTSTLVFASSEKPTQELPKDKKLEISEQKRVEILNKIRKEIIRQIKKMMGEETFNKCGLEKLTTEELGNFEVFISELMLKIEKLKMQKVALENIKVKEEFCKNSHLESGFILDISDGGDKILVETLRGVYLLEAKSTSPIWVDEGEDVYLYFMSPLSVKLFKSDKVGNYWIKEKIK